VLIPEDARTEALQDYQILDTPFDVRFDRITSLAANLFNVPIALVSLLDGERQWVKSCVGLDVRESPREWAFCEYAVATGPGAVMVVPDAISDPRFKASPLVVGPPHIRFYAGAVLATPGGLCIGTLCIIDSKPRPDLSPREADLLRRLADMVIDQLEQTRIAKEAQERSKLLEMAEAMSGVGRWRFDIVTKQVVWSPEVYRIHGVDPKNFDPSYGGALSFYHPNDREMVHSLLKRAIERKESCSFQCRIVRADGNIRHVVGKADCEVSDLGAPKALYGVFQDVTEQVLALKAIAESEARYRLLADHSSDIIVRSDAEGVIGYCSPAVRARGYEPEDLVGRKTWDFIHPDDRPAAVERVATLFRDSPRDAKARRQVRLRGKDGAYQWYDAVRSVVRDKRGRPVELISSYRDITEQKAAQDELAESERSFRTLVQGVTDYAIYRLDTDGRVMNWNAGAERAKGYRAEEIVGDHFSRFYTPEDKASGEPARALKAARDDGRYTAQGWRVRKDGSRFWADVVIDAIHDEGCLTGFTKITRDITERKKAQTALAESEARYRLLADHASDVIVVFGPDGLFRYVSPSCAKFGYKPDEVIGSSVIGFVHPDDVDFTGNRVRELFTGAPVDPATRREFRLRRKDGGYVWVEGAPTLISDAEGRPIEVLSVYRDITDRRQMEESLALAKAEAEAATAVKSEFISNMSHELRTPLTSILGFASLLGDEPGLSDHARRAVSRIAVSGQALMTIVNDILDFSKLEAGQVEIDRHPASPRETVSDALDLLEAQASAKGLSLILDADPSLPDCVLLDETRVRQILLNFLSNAVKFTEKGSVTAAVRYDARTERLRCEIIDTGVGIPAAGLKKLFQRFSQVGASTARTHGGTGLGLAICKGLVEAMGGELGVDSEVGVGSRFWFELPCAIAAPAANVSTPDEVDARSGLEGVRLLVADDTAINRELVRLFVSPHGVEVTEAAGGEDAVRLAQARPFDILLIDVRMPDKDGPSVAKAIREGGGPNAHAPLIAFTAEDEDSLAARAWSGLFDARVGKPIAISDLLSILLQHGSAAPASPLAEHAQA